MCGDVDAIVEVGATVVAELVLEPVELLDDVPVDDVPEDEEVAGDGDTIATGVVEVEDDGVEVDALAVVLFDEEDDEPFDELDELGLELSFGTPLANGSRAIRASTTLGGSVDRASAVDV